MANSVRISGVDSAINRIRGISQRASNIDAAKPAIARTLERHVHETFDSTGTSAGKPWKPLSNRYARRKRTQDTGGPLVLSGSLRDSFMGGKWHIAHSGPNSFSWGTKHPLAHLPREAPPAGEFRQGQC